MDTFNVKIWGEDYIEGGQVQIEVNGGWNGIIAFRGAEGGFEYQLAGYSSVPITADKLLRLAGGLIALVRKNLKAKDYWLGSEVVENK